MAGFGKSPFGISRAIAPGAAPSEPPPALPSEPFEAQELGDFALRWADGEIDMYLEGDDVAADPGLQTAILLSLFTDRRAEDDDELPGGEADEDRRGWWGDEFLEHEGDRHGSRLWLLERSARRGDVVPRAEGFDREALAWLLEDAVTERVDVAVEVNGERREHLITIHRPEADPVSFRFAHAWDGEARR